MAEMVTTGEVARALGVTINTVKSWIRAGKMQAVRLPSGHYRIPAAELSRLRRPPRDPAFAEAVRARRRALRRVDEWLTEQPQEERPMGELLRWVGSMLAFAEEGGAIPDRSIEEDIERVHELHRALAHARR